MGESIRARVEDFTKAQYAKMSKRQVDNHVRKIREAAREEKAAGRTQHLSYLYKALPGHLKTDEMKREILPFDMKDFRKSVPKAKKAR